MRLVLLFVALLAGAQAWAQYPSRPIRLVVPAAPGGGTDITSRSFAPALGDALGQPIVVENRGGAGGMVGSAEVAKSAPDGYTLLMVYISHATNPTLVTKLPYDTLRDFTPITLVSHEPTVLVVNSKIPVNSLAEFTAWAKARQEKLSYATDPGSAGFLAGELFLQRAGLKSQYVPYKGSGPAAADLVGGRVQIMFDAAPSLIQHVKSGKLRVLAAASARRNPLLPEVPTFAELGYPKIAVSLWYGLLAPAGTPRGVVDRLNRETVRALQSAEVRERLLAQGAEPMPATPEAFASFMQQESAKWAPIVKQAGVKLD